jgi:hypothetical protein
MPLSYGRSMLRCSMFSVEARLGSARLGSARLGSVRLGSARLGSAHRFPFTIMSISRRI